MGYKRKVKMKYLLKERYYNTDKEYDIERACSLLEEVGFEISEEDFEMAWFHCCRHGDNQYWDEIPNDGNTIKNIIEDLFEEL